MNVSMLRSVLPEPALPEPALPERLLEQLAVLPEFEPPANGFARVLERRSAERRRRLAFAVAAGVAAVAAGVGVRQVGDVRAPDTPLAARTQALEADVRVARPAAIASAPIAALEGELARLDASLQTAYDRGASREELDRLWRARTDTLSALVAAYRHSESIVRI